MTINTEHIFSKAIESIYDSTLAPDLWEKTLELCSGVSESLGNHFLVFDSSFTPQFGSIYSSYGQQFAYDAHQSYINDYAEDDFSRVKSFLMQADGASYRNEDIIAQEELKRCRVHGEYNRDFDCEKQLLFANKLSNHSHLVICSSRPDGAAQYTDDDIMFHQSICKHISHSLDMQFRLGSLFSDANDLQKIIHSSEHCVYIVDRQMRLIWCNTDGQNLLDQNQGLSILKGRLNSKDDYFNESSNKLIHQAGLLSAHNKARVGFTLLKTQDKKYSATIFSSPVESLLIRDNAPVGIIALKEISDEKEVAPFVIVSKLYNLTASETNLALGIYSGLTVKEYAAQNCISEHTVRSTLKIVLNKTNSKRQSELILKISKIKT